MEKENKQSFILHHDSLEVFSMLSNEQAGKLIKAIIDYNINGEFNVDDEVLKIAILPFINQFKRDVIKYENISERNKNNALKRWENKKKRNNAKNTNEYENIPNNAKNADSDSDSDSDNVKDSDKESVSYFKKNNIKKEKSFSLDFITDQQFKNLMEELANHRKSIKKPFRTQKGVEIVYRDLLEFSNNDYEIARRIVDNTIASGYQGIFALKQSAFKKTTKEETTAQYNLRMIQERLKQEAMEANNA